MIRLNFGHSRADSVTQRSKNELGINGLKSNEESCRIPLVQSTDGRCNLSNDLLLPNRFSVTLEIEQCEAHVHYYTGCNSSNLCDQQIEELLC